MDHFALTAMGYSLLFFPKFSFGFHPLARYSDIYISTSKIQVSLTAFFLFFSFFFSGKAHLTSLHSKWLVSQQTTFRVNENQIKTPLLPVLLSDSMKLLHSHEQDTQALRIYASASSLLKVFFRFVLPRSCQPP